MNRKKNVEDIRKNIMVPLDHMFYDHHLCDSKWCYKKRLEEDEIISIDNNAERMKTGYCRIKKDDTELFEKLCNKYEFYNTLEKIAQYRHEFDTQINERMNTCVAKYTTNTKHYPMSI